MGGRQVQLPGTSTGPAAPSISVRRNQRTVSGLSLIHIWILAPAGMMWSVVMLSPTLSSTLASMDSARGTVAGKGLMSVSYTHLFRATDQWFCSVESFRDQVEEAIHQVKWHPAWGEERMAGMVRELSLIHI